MKKIMIGLSLVLALGVFSAFTYADNMEVNTAFHMGNWGNEENRDFDSEEFQQFKEERLQYKKDNLKKAVEEKKLTVEQAKNWEEHFDYMEEFHEENGYLGGHCGGRSNEGNRRGMGMGRHHR